jgi:two-component system OmpR family response regulator
MKVLLVEDELKLQRSLAAGLVKLGYTVDTASDGEEGEMLARAQSYDVVILDGMLPKRDGVEVCRNLRQAKKMMPILMLTARGEVDDRVEGLDAGADDYLVKPFSFAELTARLRSLARRAPVVLGEILHWDDLTLNTKAQEVTVAGKKVDLTGREFELLEYFLRHPNIALTREEIQSHVWDRFFDSLSNVVDVHVKNLRQKLPSSYAGNIKTVWGKGYQLVIRAG